MPSMPVKASEWKLRFRQLILRNKKTLLAFAMPFSILLLSYLLRGIYPIANRSLLTIDLFHQYAPFLAELQAKLRGGGSLLYSWSGGLGTNFWALLAYYLGSPLNVLTIFFPASFLTEAVLLLIILKIGLAGACFYLYLRGVWHQENLLMVGLSSFYALSAYALAYSWNIMWLDSLYLLPLVMLGMVRMVRDRRYLLYILSLAMVIAVNYYIAFFVCAFTLLYFPICLFHYQSLARPGHFFAAVGKFAGFSLLSAGLASFLLLPTYFSLRLTSAAGDAFPSSLTHYFDLFDYIGQHFMLVPPTIRSGMPNLYSGVLLLILVPMYFLARSVPLRMKFLHGGLILFLLISFNLNHLNFVWHGMHFPNQLPYRNSFVYIFLILSMSYPALKSLREFRGKQIGMICGGLVVLVLLGEKLFEEPLPIQATYLTILFIALYAGVLTINKIRRLHPQDWAMAVFFVMIAELLIYTIMTVHVIDTTEHYSNREGYLAGSEVAHIKREIDSINAEHDPEDFFRMEVFPPKTTNDPYLYQYRGLSIFSSTMPTNPVSVFQNLGYHSNGINSYKYEGSNLLLDSLFGIRYLIRRSGSIDDTLRSLWVSTSEVDVYKNMYALPLGYMGKPELADWTSQGSNPFSIQNQLLYLLTGSDPVFSQIQVEETEEDHDNLIINRSGQYLMNFNRPNTSQSSMARLKVETEQSRQVYLYLDVTANQPERGYVMIDEQRINFNARRSTLVDLGWVEADSEVVLHLSFGDSAPASSRFEFYAYAFNVPVFESAIETLRGQSLQLDSFKDTKLNGTVTAHEEGVLFLTIPYDKGWSLKVNGEKQSFMAIDNGLIGVALPAGTHTIEMTYKPAWFMIGLLISLTSILVLLILYQIPGGPGRPPRKKKKAGVRPVDMQQL